MGVCHAVAEFVNAVDTPSVRNGIDWPHQRTQPTIIQVSSSTNRSVLICRTLQTGNNAIPCSGRAHRIVLTYRTMSQKLLYKSLAVYLDI